MFSQKLIVLKNYIETFFSKNNSHYFKLLIFFSIIFISFWRSPFIFINSRFLAEEATHHLKFALENSFIINIFYYDIIAGYFNIVPNLLLEIASRIPLEYSAYITVYGSFFFILLLPYLCLFRDSDFLDNDYKKILASLILFLSPPFVAEIWINSLNTQIYLCLIGILIFFMRDLSRIQKIMNHFLIFLGGFSGVYTSALIPYFAYKYFSFKSKYNLINFVILITSNITQIILIINSKLNNKLNDTVLKIDFDFDLYINFFYNIITKPFFGRQLTHYIWNKFSFFHNNYLLFFVFLFSIVSLLIILNYKELANKILNDKVLIFLILFFFTISGVVMLGSLGNYVGGRYAVVAGSLVLLIILHSTFSSNSIFLRKFGFSLILISLLSGIYEFRPPTQNVKHQYLKLLDCINCPVWKDEIKKWRQDKNYLIGIWPYPKKKMKLQ